ncbi:MAG: arsenic efflux protein [Bacteroidales bacterium]|jgi:hypothetical protein|nr:arsenic efflux protein [Bacteroidales bacterium]
MRFDVRDFLSQGFIITVVVVMMMMLIEFVNTKTQGKFLVLMKKYPNLQILFAALLGLAPGCVGIFAAVSLYTHRLISFGALLAAAISAFGDEAFLMMSLIPLQTVWICVVLFLLAVVSGYCADFFLRKKTGQSSVASGHDFEMHPEDHCHSHQKEVGDVRKKTFLHRILLAVFAGFFMTGILVGFLGHEHSFSDTFSLASPHAECQHTHNDNPKHEDCCQEHPIHNHAHSPFEGENLIFLIVGLLTLTLLLLVNDHFLEEHIWNHVIKKHFLKIFLWVLAIMLLVKLLGFLVPIETLSYHTGGKLIWLMIALLIALIPESGPNLIILFLFIDGIVPFSTLLANSVLQEGHGGLPLIAENPKSFLRLKAIKFVLALTVGMLGYAIGF